MNADFPEIVIEFYPADEATLAQLNETFAADETMRSSGFDGTIILTIIAASLPVIQRAFKFYEAHQKTIRSGKVRIKDKEVTFEGFSADEIIEIGEKGTIEKIRQKLK
ncbi:hypothetical protein [Mucilaginibacter paludis]|uniref:Uncharacterized protein n=1 Tax=Mucilaginibacter paludis DSM 18603 TaxID=714943 RepID=H1Y3H8_9SPHI|nr:hypothetical protein [Mucilaginibacter paludis]EHQ29746.1 hypothetical protein Mucpa_5677 [Mucilaginibacter paludis DSM 18603]